MIINYISHSLSLSRVWIKKITDYGTICQEFLCWIYDKHQEHGNYLLELQSTHNSMIYLRKCPAMNMRARENNEMLRLTPWCGLGKFWIFCTRSFFRFIKNLLWKKNNKKKSSPRNKERVSEWMREWNWKQNKARKKFCAKVVNLFLYFSHVPKLTITQPLRKCRQ